MVTGLQDNQHVEQKKNEGANAFLPRRATTSHFLP